jgi:hypothetical protein
MGKEEIKCFITSDPVVHLDLIISCINPRAVLCVAFAIVIVRPCLVIVIFAYIVLYMHVVLGHSRNSFEIQCVR